MSDMPAQVDAIPEQQVQEGNEYGIGGPGESFGDAVDAFNDLDGQRPGSEGMESEDPFSDVFDEGDEGKSSFMESEDESGFGDEWGMADREVSEDEAEVASMEPDLDYSMELEVEPPSMPETNPDLSLDVVDNEGVSLPEADITEPEESEANDQNPRMDEDEPRNDSTAEKNKSLSDKQDKKHKKDNESQFESKKTPIPGDNMLSRLARGEPTEEDLEKLEKEKKRQNAASAVPKGDRVHKGGGGSRHAPPREDEPSRLEAYQREIKAKQNKWDEIQSWNQRMIQRAKAQQEILWDGVRKVSKG